MAKGEADMVCDAVTRPVALVEDGPAVLGAVTALDVFAGNGACRPDRGGDAEAVNQRGPAGQPGALREEPVLESRRGIEIQPLTSKFFHLGRKNLADGPTHPYLPHTKNNESN